MPFVMPPATPARIITDAGVFSEDYVPTAIVSRDAQCSAIDECLDPIRKGRKPAHVWLHGSPGSGKSLAAKACLARLRSEAGTPLVHVNCWERGTLYEILDQAVADLKIFRAEEHRISAKLERLKRAIGDRRIVFLLDEVDRISPRERAAVLQCLDTMGNSGIVCTSNTLAPLLELEERVRSRINPRVVGFGRYTEDEVLAILTHRSAMGLANDAASEPVLRHIASLCSGDARLAIQSLRNAAEAAERAGRHRIIVDDVLAGWHNSQAVRTAGVLARLTDDHRSIFQLASSRDAVLSTDLWEAYLQECSRRGRRPIASRTFSDYINQLTRLGLLTCERARVKGNVRLLRVGR